MSDAEGAIIWSNCQLVEFSALRPSEIIDRAWLTVLCSDQGHPFLTRAVPLNSARGVDRWLGTHIDISELKEREAHVQLIADELSHRSKNQLAVVQQMGQTRDVSDYHARLGALAKSNDLLLHEHWHGGLLHDLVRHQLKAIGGVDQSRIDVAGPPVKFHAGAVQYLGLPAHERATHASKFGALSAVAGRVSIRWMADDYVQRGK